MAGAAFCAPETGGVDQPPDNRWSCAGRRLPYSLDLERIAHTRVLSRSVGAFPRRSTAPPYQPHWRTLGPRTCPLPAPFVSEGLASPPQQLPMRKAVHRGRHRLGRISSTCADEWNSSLRKLGSGIPEVVRTQRRVVTRSLSPSLSPYAGLPGHRARGNRFRNSQLHEGVVQSQEICAGAS